MKQAKLFIQHLLLVLVGLVSAISAKAANYDFKAENSDGVTIYYKISEEEATVVAGDEKYTGNVVIPETVTNDGKEYAVTEIGNSAFYECSMLTSVIIPEKVTKLGRSCFRGCSALSHIDIPSSISAIPQYAFWGCSALRELELLPGLLTIDNYAFRNCTSLSSVSLPNTLTSIGEESFYNTKIETLDIPNSVTLIGAWSFASCDELKNIYLPSSLNFIGSRAFGLASGKLESIYSSITIPFSIADDVFDSDVKGKATLNVPAGTKELYQSKGGWDFRNIVEMEPENKAYAVWCEGNTTLYFLTSSETLSEGGTYDGQTISNMWSGKDVLESPFNSIPVWNATVRGRVTNIVVEETFREALPISTSGWFAFCEELETINGLSNLNTNNVTDMTGMFAGCKNLLSVDVSGFNTSKVTAMASMFYGCSTLNMLNLENFNTQEVTDMSRMFWGCTNLKKLTVSNFDTQNVTTFYCTFANCTSLKNIDVSGFSSENVKNMRAMFGGCNSLENVDLSNFDSRKVTGMGLMFAKCYALKELDLSSFYTAKVENIDSMFFDCTNLKTIYAGNGWSMENVKAHKNMFENCRELVGGNGTKYDANYTNKTYACIDTKETPGYLTARTAQIITLSANMQTFCSNKDLDFTGVEGIKAYIASGFSPSTGEVLMSHVNLVPAKTGLLLVGTAGQEYEVPFTETDFIYSNLLRGLVEDVEVTSGYVLTDTTFTAVNGTVTVHAGEAYLNIPPTANAPRLAIQFSDTESTGIETTDADAVGISTTWYTLQGARLEGKPTKQGIYLHQGRKVVVK